jgi:uncharacterized LabA/DUF88 family protein
MVFVDGTNVLAELGRHLDLDIDPHKPPAEAIELVRAALSFLRASVLPAGTLVVRSYWFGSYTGSDEDRAGLFSLLHGEDRFGTTFQPLLVHKGRRQDSEKGVDVSLAIEMLTNAFHRNFDLGILFSGDEDYARLVLETKRYGTMVGGAFFEKHGLSARLRSEFDAFYDLANLVEVSKSAGEGGDEVEKARAALRAVRRPARG